ncbi:MAG: pyridoxal-dependent decarboxylase [Acidimicrobiales bacterium]
MGGLLGLPEHFRHGADGPGGGVLQDSASSSTLCTILAARQRCVRSCDGCSTAPMTAPARSSVP